MIELAAFFLFLGVGLGIYSFVAALICSQLSERRRWWCPVCLVFGKRYIP